MSEAAGGAPSSCRPPTWKSDPYSMAKRLAKAHGRVSHVAKWAIRLIGGGGGGEVSCGQVIILTTLMYLQMLECSCSFDYGQTGLCDNYILSLPAQDHSKDKDMSHSSL